MEIEKVQNTLDSGLMTNFIEEEKEILQTLLQETKTWQEIDQNWKLALKDYMIKTVAATEVHQKPFVSEDLVDLQKWLSDISDHQLHLADRYASASSRIRHTRFSALAVSRAMDSGVQELSVELARLEMANERLDAKKAKNAPRQKPNPDFQSPE